jgi:hypothetical protein
MLRPGGDNGRARLGVRAPEVIHETIDGEVIIINLATGTYYSLKGSAADIWELIQEPAGASEADVVAAVEARYAAPRSDIETAVTSFLGALTAEGLVSPVEGRSDLAPAASRHAGDHGAARQAFTPPALEKFTDMQDLVLLDPVHEVSEMGWPQRRDESTAPAS